MNRGSGVFSRSALIILVTGAVALLAASFLLSAMHRPDLRLRGNSGPKSRSISAIGYAAWTDLLDKYGPWVERDAVDFLDIMDSDDVLVVLEPELATLARGEKMTLRLPDRLLMVLPKWRGIPAERPHGWLKQVGEISPLIVEATLGLVVQGGAIGEAQWPTAWETNELGVDPTGAFPVQLIKHPDATPLVGCDDGMLLARFDLPHQTVFVLSDPDVLNNHGIVLGDNADFALGLAYHVIGETGYLYFDEAGDAHGRGASPLSLLVRFPFVVVTVLMAAAGVLLVMSAGRRFGPPARRESGSTAGYGKELLLRNSARILDYSGHQAAVLRRYLDQTFRETGEALHAPPGLSREGLTQWFDPIEKTREAGSCRDILTRADRIRLYDKGAAARLFQAANELHMWKERVLDGTGKHRHAGREHQTGSGEGDSWSG